MGLLKGDKTEYKRQKRREYNDKYKLKQWNKNKLFVNRVKRIFGCCECGYNKKPQAMDFHHLKDKKFAISVMVRSGFTIKLIKEEIRKCRLLCGNCHRELHNPI